jgi:uncharacterized protein
MGDMSHLTENDKMALKMFKERLLKEFPDQVKELKLFGSKARGEAAKHSDVDVLVILRKGDWSKKMQVHAVANKVFLVTGIDLSPKIFTAARVEQLREFGSPFIKSVKRDGIDL